MEATVDPIFAVDVFLELLRLVCAPLRRLAFAHKQMQKRLVSDHSHATQRRPVPLDVGMTIVAGEDRQRQLGGQDRCRNACTDRQLLPDGKQVFVPPVVGRQQVTDT
eukprot:1741065-Rhodomonas_salina.1